jgi:hypothetical protein
LLIAFPILAHDGFGARVDVLIYFGPFGIPVLVEVAKRGFALFYNVGHNLRWFCLTRGGFILYWQLTPHSQ